MDLQSILSSQNNPDKVDKAGGFTLPDLKLYYKAISIKQYGISIGTDT